MDRRWTLSLILLAGMGLAACSMATPSPTVAPSATPAPSLVPTRAPSATATMAPTATHTPTATFEPAPDLDSSAIETALRAEGYKRHPFYSGSETAYFWDNGSGIAFQTYSDSLQIAILNDTSDLPARLGRLDQAIDVLAPLFSSQFLTGFRNEAHSYADRVVTFSGEPTILDYGQEPWLGKLMQFNAYETAAQNGREVLPIYFALLYREYKCDMRKYQYCYFSEMPSMTYTGGATLTTFNIWIDLSKSLAASSG